MQSGGPGPSCGVHSTPAYFHKRYINLLLGSQATTHSRDLKELTSFFCLFLPKRFLRSRVPPTSSSSKTGASEVPGIGHSSFGTNSSLNIVSTKFTSHWLKGFGLVGILMGLPFSLPFTHWWYVEGMR